MASAQVGQGPQSARIRWLREEAHRQVAAWYANAPRRVVATYEAADRFFDQGDIHETKAAFLRLIGWFPGGPHRRVAEFWIAYCDELLGHREAALRGYHRVAAASPEKGDLWRAEATARIRLLTREATTTRDLSESR